MWVIKKFHFMDENTVVQRGKVICPGSYGKLAMGQPCTYCNEVYRTPCLLLGTEYSAHRFWSSVLPCGYQFNHLL